MKYGHKRGRKARVKLDLPYCVIAEKSCSRTWFATEAEAVAHASTLDAKREQYMQAKYGANSYSNNKIPQTEFAIVRVTAKVGPKPPVEPPVAVSYYR